MLPAAIKKKNDEHDGQKVVKEAVKVAVSGVQGIHNQNMFFYILIRTIFCVSIFLSLSWPLQNYIENTKLLVA
jgi:hypothetical protein